MKQFLQPLKKIWLLNFFRRLFNASQYYNHKYLQMLKWGFSSREDTNYTYHITGDNVAYTIHTVSAVTGKSYDEIAAYVREIQNDERLKETVLTAIENSPEKRFADKEVRFGRRVGWYAIVRAMKPAVIIETGVDKGLGAILLCAALLRNKEEGHSGKYFGTDINPKAGYFLQSPYTDVGEILYGDSITTLQKFTDKIDLFINDSDHSPDYEYDEYLAIKPLIDDKTIILGDNCHCTDKLAKFSREENRQFVYIQEVPKNHWYPGAGIGISFVNSRPDPRP